MFLHVPNGGSFNSSTHRIIGVTDTKDLVEYNWSNLPASGGIPSGGSKSQLLRKNSATNGDASWLNAFRVNTATVSGSVTWDIQDFEVLNLTLTGNINIVNPTNLVAGLYAVIINQNATGGWTVSWGSNFSFLDGTPYLNTSSNGVTIFTFQSNGISLFGEPTRTAPLTTEYTTAGTYTYTPPVGYKELEVWIVGGGGGGGSGRRGLTTEVRGGGGGGGGGGVAFGRFTFAQLGTTNLSVTVGAGGTGGTSATTDSTNGTNGFSGGATVIQQSSVDVIRAAGGVNGFAGTTAAGSSGTGGAGTYTGSNGGAGGATANAGPGLTSIGPASNGGGGGGGITAANALRTAASGGASNISNQLSATVNNNGFVASSGLFGYGGGGGSASITANANAGGNGVRGGGGGGGGASRNGFNSGAGGNGGDGYVRIIAYF